MINFILELAHFVYEYSVVICVCYTIFLWWCSICWCSGRVIQRCFALYSGSLLKGLFMQARIPNVMLEDTLRRRIHAPNIHKIRLDIPTSTDVYCRLLRGWRTPPWMTDLSVDDGSGYPLCQQRYIWLVSFLACIFYLLSYYTPAKFIGMLCYLQSGRIYWIQRWGRDLTIIFKTKTYSLPSKPNMFS
jgi:hypothetical protein